MNLEICPKCESLLNTLSSSGRQICSSCKWTEPVEKTTTELKKNYFQVDKDGERQSKEEIPKPNNSQKESVTKTEQKSNNAGAIILFVLGVIVTFSGLNYDTTSCDYNYGIKSGCVHNTGLLNDRSNIVNVGGFLCVCGCVLFSKHQKIRIEKVDS